MTERAGLEAAETLLGPTNTADAPVEGRGSCGAELLAGRYELLSLLGTGGMGTVYRARDRELDEIVALKMLKRELVGEPAALERFRQEVKLARRVTHPNVARTFDIGEHGGEKFLTMEYVEGASLGAVLARRGRFSSAEITRIAEAVADGLGAAHDAGVVHRDLKPDNVLVSATGRIVVTDFGIARGGSEGSGTAAGHIVGTPTYMAPEQVEGGAIDGRADLYALGLVLFELATGERAWPGDAPFAVAAARLMTPPPDVRALRPDLPEALCEIIARCLARRRDGRFATAAELAGALRRAHSAPAPVGLAPGGPREQGSLLPSAANARAERAIAVLPFRNAGPPESAWMAEGLTEDLVDALSGIRGIRVRARSGVAPGPSAAPPDPRAVGLRLGVQVIVEGSVRSAGETVRINVRLLSVEDGFQLWAQRFDCRVGELLAMNDQAARAVATALDGLGPGRGHDAADDSGAIELYLRARHELARAVAPGPELEALLTEAAERAPNNPTIMAEYATLRARSAFRGATPADRRERLHAARAAAERAIEVAPHLGEPWVALAHVRNNDDDPVGAVRALARAAANSPSLATAHDLLGRILVEVDLLEEGLLHAERAVWLDSSLHFAEVDRARVHALLGRWGRAEEVLLGLRARSPSHHALATSRLGVWAGHSLGEVELISEDQPMVRKSALLLDRASRSALEDEDWAFIDGAAESLPLGSRQRRFFQQLRAEVLAISGRVPEALEATRESVAAGLVDLAWMRRCPTLAAVRELPGFPALLAEVASRAEPIRRAYRESLAATTSDLQVAV